ncbi:casein kinase 2 beta 2 subunit [Grosmannia clavigera kw1407]|uniref:Casein kinase 2 beta 2 subunit n=1 Tax=Grosmannia clavigera (strain kw1407 / UAMH 11150) TaxID=655863 RepID=F0XDR4_GROCL|nr:casein kinase 2 beta 2 subunit [Grosmannia clavigera kw1407]EFX03992.1 casein kinase 2 beta 2 subunit [Grosmannia clavigera kw1407]
MAPLGGIWVPMAQRILKQALSAGARMTEVVRINISAASRISQVRLEPAAVRTAVSGGGVRQPLHPFALRRQLKRSGTRWYHARQTSTSSTLSFSFSPRRFHAAVRRFIRTGRPSRPRHVDRAAFLQSPIASQAVWRAPGRAPFASALRPSLTGGALPRTAGGYAAGAAGRGGARYFSHAPAAPAQVVQNVSQAMRAFWLSGQRARFDGTDGQGRTCYRAISSLEEETARRLAVPALPALAPGAFVDFPLTPTITALAPLMAAGVRSRSGSGSAFPSKMATGFGFTAAPAATTSPTTLNTEGFLDVLGVDFSRALQELGAVMADLRRLAGLGDLPVLLEHDAVLRVRFPGVDAVTVDRLCEDLGVTRGLVGQDPGFDTTADVTLALRFPFAPDKAKTASLTSPGESTRESSAIDEGIYTDYDDMDDVGDPWLLSLPPSPHSHYGGLEPAAVSSGQPVSSEPDGLQGVYRFLKACDQVQGRC